jgi:L-fuconolactonase
MNPERATNRRAFLKRMAAMSSAGFLIDVGKSASAEAPPAPQTGRRKQLWKGRAGMIPIVDTHQHLWDLKRFRLPWLAGGGPLATDHRMSDYLKAAEGVNVVKTIYMEVDVTPEQHEAEADYVIDLCRRDDNPMVAAVIGGRPASDGFAAYLQRFRGSPYVKGVRQVLHGGSPKGACLEAGFVRGVRLLGEAGLRFDLCLRSEELRDGAKLADLCPNTRFILDHCGNANVQAKDRTAWQRDIAEVAKRKNVICKISGIVASAKPGAWTADDLAPIVRHCVESFGKERIVFGSDWPVCTLAATYRQWVEALQAIVASWSEADKKRLFHDNAVVFYDLH